MNRMLKWVNGRKVDGGNYMKKTQVDSRKDALWDTLLSSIKIEAAKVIYSHILRLY